MKEETNKQLKEENLRKVLEDELKTMYRMIGIMQPTSETEFIKVALPNIHIKLFHFLQSQKESLVENERQGLKKLQKEIKGGVYGHDDCRCQSCAKTVEIWKWLDKCFEDYQSLIKQDN